MAPPLSAKRLAANASLASPSISLLATALEQRADSLAARFHFTDDNDDAPPLGDHAYFTEKAKKYRKATQGGEVGSPKDKDTSFTSELFVTRYTKLIPRGIALSTEESVDVDGCEPPVAEVGEETGVVCRSALRKCLAEPLELAVKINALFHDEQAVRNDDDDGEQCWEDLIGTLLVKEKKEKHKRMQMFAKGLTVLKEARLRCLLAVETKRWSFEHRSAIDEAAKSLRLFFAGYEWDGEFTQWFHDLALEHFPAEMLAVYLEVCKALCSESCRSLLERVIVDARSTSVLRERDQEVFAELIAYLQRREWSPLDFVPQLGKVKSVARLPIFVLISPTPSFGCDKREESSRFAKLCKFYLCELGEVGKCVQVSFNLPDKSLTSAECSELMLATLFTRVKEIRQANRGKSIVLVGFDVSAVLACKVALQIPISAVVALSFPVRTLAGPHGEVDDELLDNKCPVLFVVGQFSRVASVEDVQDMRDHMKGSSGLIVVGGADHSLRVSSRKLRLEGLSQHAIDRCIVDEIGRYLNSIFAYTHHAKPTGIPVTAANYKQKNFERSETVAAVVSRVAAKVHFKRHSSPAGCLKQASVTECPPATPAGDSWSRVVNEVAATARPLAPGVLPAAAAEIAREGEETHRKLPRERREPPGSTSPTRESAMIDEEGTTPSPPSRSAKQPHRIYRSAAAIRAKNETKAMVQVHTSGASLVPATTATTSLAGSTPAVSGGKRKVDAPPMSSQKINIVSVDTVLKKPRFDGAAGAVSAGNSVDSTIAELVRASVQSYRADERSSSVSPPSQPVVDTIPASSVSPSLPAQISPAGTPTSTRAFRPPVTIMTAGLQQRKPTQMQPFTYQIRPATRQQTPAAATSASMHVIVSPRKQAPTTVLYGTARSRGQGPSPGATIVPRGGFADRHPVYAGAASREEASDDEQMFAEAISSGSLTTATTVGSARLVDINTITATTSRVGESTVLRRQHPATFAKMSPTSSSFSSAGRFVHAQTPRFAPYRSSLPSTIGRGGVGAGSVKHIRLVSYPAGHDAPSTGEYQQMMASPSAATGAGTTSPLLVSEQTHAGLLLASSIVGSGMGEHSGAGLNRQPGAVLHTVVARQPILLNSAVRIRPPQGQQPSSDHRY